MQDSSRCSEEDKACNRSQRPAHCSVRPNSAARVRRRRQAAKGCRAQRRRSGTMQLGRTAAWAT
jgi:hypothetical protein